MLILNVFKWRIYSAREIPCGVQPDHATDFAAAPALWQPVPLLAHGSIQILNGLPQLLPLAARPGVASRCRLTLWTFWPGGLLPRLPPPNGFALFLPLLRCPSACCHAVLTLIVRFAGVGFALRARSPARNAPDTFGAEASNRSVCYGCRHTALGLLTHDQIQQFN